MDVKNNGGPTPIFGLTPIYSTMPCVCNHVLKPIRSEARSWVDSNPMMSVDITPKGMDFLLIGTRKNPFWDFFVDQIDIQKTEISVFFFLYVFGVQLPNLRRSLDVLMYVS